jgi:hypothetical protein
MLDWVFIVLLLTEWPQWTIGDEESRFFVSQYIYEYNLALFDCESRRRRRLKERNILQADCVFYPHLQDWEQYAKDRDHDPEAEADKEEFYRRVCPNGCLIFY